MRAAPAVLFVLVAFAAACAPREGAVGGAYLGGAAGGTLRQDPQGPR